MKKTCLALIFLLLSVACYALERQYLWDVGKMPNAQGHQIAAMTDVSTAEGFNPDDYRIPYIEWQESPAPEVANGACMILISGGGYYNCCDIGLIKLWNETFTKLGFQCVNLVYRTPRPEGLPIYQTAWQDGQRAVRMIRRQAQERGFDPERIGTVSMSAGSHLAMLLAASSQSQSYSPIDELDTVPCHINFAIANAPAYVTTDGEEGTPAWMDGYGPGVKLSDCFKFDAKTCPVSLHHGGTDIYSPNGSTLLYRELRKTGMPAELHLYPNKGHGAFGLERGIEFLRQIGIMGTLADEEEILARIDSDSSRISVAQEKIWPEGKMPNAQAEQCIPYIEWHFPKERKTDAIQIIYSGGAYVGNDPNSFEVAPVRRKLNDMGMTVVTLKYRTPRPEGLPKHVTAWQDLQRAIRIVRSKAPDYGLDPNQIGIMGSSAGGHLTLMGTTSSMQNSYWPIDDTDKQPCNVQWGIGIYPAYVLSDGADGPNAQKGNGDNITIAPDFNFDLNTSPMLFIHGDDDVYSTMGSVMVWEKMRSMGIQSELHTLALRNHCFQMKASEGTGSYNWIDRIVEFLQDQQRL